MLTPRLATAADVEWLAPRLRQEDVDEVRAASGGDPLAALMDGLRYSVEPSVGVDEEDRPVVMYGVCPTDDPLFGSIWLLGSDDIHKHRVSFLRQTRTMMPDFHRVAPVLGNYVDERNTVHIQWLRWLGFIFLRRIPDFGFEKRPFLEFVRHQCVTR